MIENENNSDLEINNEQVEDNHKPMITIIEGRNHLNGLRDYFQDSGLLNEEILEKFLK